MSVVPSTGSGGLETALAELPLVDHHVHGASPTTMIGAGNALRVYGLEEDPGRQVR